WTFRPTIAVKDLSLSVEQGEAFGFLGANGAGKTTTMKCIIGLLQKTWGHILLDGEEASHCSKRSHLGYLPELPYFYDHLSVEDTLHSLASLCDLTSLDRKSRVASALELLSLIDKRKTPVRSLSKGLKQGVGLAQAFVHPPRLLFLDEPFSGLDPLG